MTQQGSFEHVADVYDESRGGRPRARGFAEQLAERLRPGDPVLDVGVGTGIVAEELVGLGHRVFGVDVSPAMLARARERLGDVVAVADAAALPFASGSFSQAVSTWLLHVVPDRAGVFRELARVLRPGGSWYVIPARTSRPRDEIGDLVGRVDRAADPEGRRRDDEEGLAGVARDTGFEVAEVFGHRDKQFDESPADVADGLEAGLYSCTWPTDRDTVTVVVRDTVAALRALPRPREPRTRSVHDYVIHLRRR